MGIDHDHPAGPKTHNVHGLFNRIARRYDLINDLQSFGLHRIWKKHLVALAGVGHESIALDLCCGTGDLTFRLARRQFRVVGMDFSAAMLAVAQRRMKSQVKSHIIWLQADALKIPFPDNLFDLVTVGYGLRNLTDIPLGLAEIRRVLKPGGKLLILDFGKPVCPFWRMLYFAYLRTVVPLWGWLCCDNARAYAYILPSLKAYPAQPGISQLLTQHRFQSVKLINFLGGLTSIHQTTKPTDARPLPHVSC